MIRCSAILAWLAALVVPSGALALPVSGLPGLPGTGTLPTVPGTGIVGHNPAGGVLQSMPSAGVLEHNPATAIPPIFRRVEMDVQTDLRQVLGRSVPGRFSRTYCGGGSLGRCRALLSSTLLQAASEEAAKYGPSMSGWQLPTTCAVTTPGACDQIVPTSAGAISIPPQPFDNRGTFYQTVAVQGHR